MSKEDNVKDRLAKEFRTKMESIRKEKQKVKETPVVVSKSDTLERASRIIKTVVESFVDEDRSLSIQHSDVDNIFVAYGYSQVCRIGITAQGDVVRVEFQVDSGAVQCVYSGAIKESKIKASLKEQLLSWYNSIF